MTTWDSGTIEFCVEEWERFLGENAPRLAGEDDRTYADRIKYAVFALRDAKDAPRVRWT